MLGKVTLIVDKIEKSTLNQVLWSYKQELYVYKPLLRWLQFSGNIKWVKYFSSSLKRRIQLKLYLDLCSLFLINAKIFTKKIIYF